MNGYVKLKLLKPPSFRFNERKPILIDGQPLRGIAFQKTCKETSMKKPSADDLHTAAQWLDIYYSAEDAEACQRVRAWLLEQAEAAEFREACRKAGVSVMQARKAARQAQKT